MNKELIQSALMGERELQVNPGDPTDFIDKTSLQELFLATIPEQHYNRLLFPFRLHIMFKELPKGQHGHSLIHSQNESGLFTGAYIVISSSIQASTDPRDELLAEYPTFKDQLVFYHEWKHLISQITSTSSGSEQECEDFAMQELGKIINGESEPVIRLESNLGFKRPV